MKSAKLDYSKLRVVFKLKSGLTYISSLPSSFCQHKIFMPIDGYKDGDVVNLTMVDVKPSKNKKDKVVVYKED